MATFAVYTHVGDQKSIHVNLDTVQMIEPYQDGALIKFAGGAALYVRETPDQVARARDGVLHAPDRAAHSPERVAHAPTQVPHASLQPPNPLVQAAHASGTGEKRQGSFRINLATGKWVDFETGDGGSDVVSLAAYIQTLSEFDAARLLATITGLSMNVSASKEPASHRRMNG